MALLPCSLCEGEDRNDVADEINNYRDFLFKFSAAWRGRNVCSSDTTGS